MRFPPLFLLAHEWGFGESCLWLLQKPDKVKLWLNRQVKGPEIQFARLDRP
jgi:hypothetical protein